MQFCKNFREYCNYTQKMVFLPFRNHQCVKQETKDSASYTQCWPKDWLPEDCKYLRVIGINYDTSLSMWAPMCRAEQTKTTLEERSDEFLEKLLKAGVGQRPIIWVTHSMGGLLVKNILCKGRPNNSCFLLYKLYLYYFKGLTLQHQRVIHKSLKTCVQIPKR